MSGESNNTKPAPGQGRNTASTRAPRRGLVLAGGGAKGAYTFGCLLAFKEAGIAFDVVAGTSVGALNAAIWSSGALDEGRELWRTISYRSVYPLKAPRWVPGRLAQLATFAFVFARTLAVALRGLPTPLHRYAHVLFASIAVMPALTVVPYIGFSSALMGAGVWGLLVLSPRRMPSRRPWAAWYVLGLCVCLLPLMVVVKELGAWEAAPVALAPAFLLTLLALGSLYSGAGRLSCLSQRPLAMAVQRLLERSPCRIPIYVTLAQEREVWDPDSGAYFDPSGAEMPDTQSSGHYLPLSWRDWVPVYMRIDGRSPAVAMRLCMASAALPFGIVPSVRVGRRRFIDGGVIDNLPFTPIVESVDELFVVLLTAWPNDQTAMTANGITAEHWSKRVRSLEVAYRAIPKHLRSRAEISNLFTETEPPETVPFRKPSRWPKVRVFYPSADLGGFFNGTLKFESRFASRLIELGLRETRAKLSAIAAQSAN